MAKVSSFTQDYAKKREEQVRENGYERFGTQTYGLRDLAAQVRPAASQRPVTAEASTEPARNQIVRPEFADQGISNSRGDTRILTGEPLNLTREGQWAAKHPIAGTLMYGVSNLVGGAEGLINTGEAALRALATGQKFNPNNIHAAPIAQGFRTGAAEGFRREAQEEHPRISSALGIDSNDGRYTFGEKAMDFLTGVGADAVSSGISMATGGPLSTALMGGSAANQALYETSQDQNTTARQAVALATANGIAEAFFEHFSIERLMHFQNPTSTAQAVRAALAQAGVEASEEMATEIANTVSDIAIRRGNSERGREYQERLTNGEDPNSAARNTAMSAVTQVLLSGLGGALSGGLHTGMAMYGNTLSNGMDLRRDIQNGITLEDIAGSIDTSTAEGQRVQNLANDIAQREASGTMASDTELGYLRNAIANAAEVAEQNEARNATNEIAPVEDVASETTPQESIPERKAATQMMNDVASETANDTSDAFRFTNYYNSQRMTPGERIFNAEMSQDMASTFGEEGRKAFSALPAEEGVKAYREWASHYNSMRLGIPAPQNIEHNLSPEQISAAMRAGALDLNRAYPQETMKAVNRAVNKIRVNGVNAGNTDLSGIDYKSLAPQQKLRVDYTSTFITKGLGMDVRYVKSEAVDGKYRGMNGSFQVINRRPTITLDVNAGMNRESDWTGDITDIKTMLPVISHETTHFLEQYNPKLYKELSSTVLAALQNSGTYSKGMTINSIIEAERKRLNDTIRDENGKPVQHSQEDAIHELVARACEDMLSGDKKALDAFNSLDAQTKQTLWDHVKQVFDNIREFFSQMLSSYKSDSAEAKAIRQNMEEFEKIRDLWMNALDGSHAEDIGISIDTVTESAAPTGPELSYRSWNASDWVQYKKEAAKELADALDVSAKTATKYINDVNSIAKMIIDDQARLDYDSSEGRSAFVSNTEYGGSIDFSTLCKKRLLYTGTIQAIQNLLPNTALTPAEYLQIRQMMLDAGHEVTCGLCYVEGSRVKMGVYTKEFIEKYKKTNPEYVPTMAEMNTPDGQEKLRSEHPEVYDAYVYFMNHYGTLSKGEKALFASQQKPKLYTLRTEYKGEIKKKFGGAKNRASVADKNLNGGLRIQSFSDFEIVHMIDMMQVIMDMSEAGLAGQAYTKVPEFADSFGRTGLKINCSLITKGVDENGNLIFDDREGMNHERAFELRNKYSKNVGTVLVVFNQEQLKAALADDRIDYVLPFHKSQWTSEQYDAIGLPEGTIDFTNYQNDYIKGAKSKENIMPMEYWDFSKSGRENAERYLQICAEEGRTPKFARIRGDNLLIDNGDGAWSLPDGPLGDGYFKLLIDFKMYDNNGKGARQMPVRPNFSMDEIRTALNDYKGGHRSFPVANDIVQEFVDNYKAQNPRTEYSLRMVDEVEPSSSAWKSGFTTEQAMEVFPNLWNVAAEESDTKNPTSVKVTLSSYKKIYDQLKAEGFNGTIMDASSGLGYGTESGINDYGFDVEDIEPYPGNRHEPTSRDYSTWDKTYDVVISNAVLNVLPQEQRDAMVSKIGEMLKPGGRAFVNVRSVNDVKAAKSKLALDADNGEYVITSTGSYQKGFSEKELVAYLKDALGEGYTVTPSTKKYGSGSNVWAEIRKDGKAQYSTRDSSGRDLTTAQAEYFRDSKARDAEGRLLTLYHGTASAGFTEFKGSVWLTTSKRDADSYGGNWEGKAFDPDEKPEVRKTTGKTYPVGEHMRFESKEDRDAFLKSYPDAESYLTEREYIQRQGELDGDLDADDYDERSDELQRLRRRSEQIERAYARYERGHSASTTIGAMLEEPSLYSLNDFKRAWTSIDREASFDDEFDNYDSDEEYRDALADRLRRYITEENADDHKWQDEMLSLPVKARIPEGRQGEIFNSTNNRTYELYANVVNPFVFDNHGRGSEGNGTFHRNIEKAMADPQYDGVIALNARVGQHQDLGTVVVAKNSDQVKLASNQNPTADNDIRRSQRNVDIDARIDALVKKYGAMPTGEHPQRSEQLPKQTSDGKNLRRFARTVWESGITTDDIDNEIKKAIIDESLSYEVKTDEEAAEYASSVIRIGGTERAQKEWDRARRSDTFNKDHMALGQFLLKEYAKNNDVENAMKMIQELAAEGTRMGQNIQAMRMLKKYSQKVPAIGLGYIQRTVDQMNRDAKRKMGKKFQKMEIDQKLADAYLNAKTQDEIDSAIADIYIDLGSQVQKTTTEDVVDRLRTWRYMAMLGNPRTHIRNLVGNALFVPAVQMKNAIGAGLEGTMKTKTRTKAVRISKEAAAFAKQDAIEMKDRLSGRQDLSIRDLIMEQRKVFSSKALNTLSEKNSQALEAEDWIFLRRHYENSLAQYITANKLDTTQENPAWLGKAREYAVLEAQKATYRDANKVSAWLNQSGKAGTIVKYMMEGMLPFKKTPTNILRRGVEYSPAGLVATLTKGTRDLNTGKITVNEWIDGVSSGLTGTAIFGLGMFLASTGAILGGYDDDDDKELRKLKGLQEYSVRIGNKTYTIDWAAPGSLPLFIGVETMSALQSERGVTMDDMGKSVMRMIDPMINMSMLSGLNDTLDAISYSENKLSAAAMETFYSLLGQYVPTLFGQVARTIDTTQRINYQDKNKGMSKDMLYFIEKMQNKIPFLTFSNDPYLNEFGQENDSGPHWAAALQNFVSPGYISSVKDDKVINEIERLQEAQEENVLPKKMPKYLGTKENRVDLTSEQYTLFQRTAGQTAYNILDRMIDDRRYDRMNADEQAAAIKMAYDYAKAVGRIAVQPEYESGLKGDTKKIYNAVKDRKQAFSAILDLCAEKKEKKNSK